MSDFLEFFTDEQGKRSSGRLAYWITLPWIMILITLDASFSFLVLSTEAYQILTTIFVGNLMWTSGPRIAQYMSGFWGSVMSRLRGKTPQNFKTKEDFGEEE